ncbi:MAG: HAMP domain-containing histidine kinase [Defluviitaleaceae bacterium]|nr:HAMP domain-containing histidine kinase [Defluviitaleaceae bacterium]
MKSFTQKLILYCTGVVFISLMAVYFLFNAMVGNYIRAEAERELAGGMTDVVHLTHANPAVMFNVSSGPLYSVRILEHEHVPYITESRFRMEQRRLVERYSTFPPHIPARTDDISIVSGREPQPGDNWVEGAAHVTFISPIRQQSFVTTDVIMIGSDDEIITPLLEFLPYIQRAEVEFLADYYLSNRGRFVDDAMTMVTGAGSIFYLNTASQTIQDSTISILMYTDISSTMAFVSSMNRILGALLVLSALLSLTISVAISARFKRAIVKLCNRAETIGRGNFNEIAGPFKDTEFDRLSKSMDNMSGMLYAYENSQKKFFQNVSHELRTPLMSMLGYAEGIMKDVFTKEEAADIILAEGQKMARLVDELLYISRIDNENASQISAISNLDVNVLLYDCCERVKPIARQAGKQIEIASPSQQITIDANPEALERAIINILSNAIRHAESKVNINYHRVNDSLEIQIEDDGNGISQRDLPHIFERFYKGEKGNHGLGLAISKDIISASGGNITAKNKNAPKKGAVFTITLQL